MASVLYEKLASEFQDLEDRYTSLLEKFRETGDDEIFIDLDADLIILQDEASKLVNLEERFEIVNEVVTLRGLIKAKTHSPCC